MFKKVIFIGGSVVTSLLIVTNNTNLSDRFKTALSLSQDPLSIGKKWNSDWDIGPDGIVKKKSKATRHLLLIRHGQYVFRDEDAACKLTILGREQADSAGKRLKESGLRYDVIVHSNMTRALETASIISKHLPEIKVTVDPDLAEGSPYVVEPPLPQWHPSSDEIHNDHKRIETAFQRYFHRASPEQNADSYTILVCHANVIRYMICRALQFPPEGWIRLSLDNGSISWVSIKPDGVVAVRAIGNSGFMSPDSITVT